MNCPPRPGPPRMDAAAFAPPNPDTQPPPPAPALARKKSSVVVDVEADLLARLRAHCTQARTSPTEMILTAHLELTEQLQAELEPNPTDQRRVALGLPRAAASRRLGPGKPLSLWLSSVALADLDAAADAAGITRRRYVTALVEALLAAAHARPRAHPDPAG